MNRVRALGRQARREARTHERLLRGLPARRPAVRPAPSGALRQGWQSAGLRHADRPAAPRLLGPRQPSASLAGRATVPVRSREPGPIEFGVPLRIVPATKTVVVEQWPTNEGWPTTDEWNDVEPWVSADEQAVAAVAAAAAAAPAAAAPADVAPADVAPADVAPADVAPAEVAPAEVAEVAEVADAIDAIDTAAPAVADPADPVTADVDADVHAVAVGSVATVADPVTGADADRAQAPSTAPDPVTDVDAAAEHAEAPSSAPEPEPEPAPEPEPTAGSASRTASQPTTPEPAALPIATTTADRLRPPRRLRRRTAAVAAVVALGVVGTVGGVLLAGSGPDDPSASVAATTAVPAPAAAWLRANVPPGSTIVTTDGDVVTGLRAAGLDVTRVADLAVAPAAGVVVGPLGGGPADTATVVDDSRSLVPLARFTTGGAAVAIGQLVDRSASDVAQDAQSVRDTAGAATAGLLANAAVTVDADARSTFAAGTLDLRVAAFLVLVAGDQRVQVLTAPQDAAERAVGLPVRSLVVRVDDRSLLQRSVDSSRFPYAPTVTVPPGDAGAGSLLLTWPGLRGPRPRRELTCARIGGDTPGRLRS